MPIMVPSAQEIGLDPISVPRAPQLSDGGLGTIAQGVGVAADQLRAGQEEIDRKRNATRVFEAEAQLADSERTMRTSAQERKGSSAYGVTDTVASWWEAEPAKVMATLENETQRELFAQAVSRRREVSLNGFSEYEARETDAAVQAASQARIEIAVDSAAASFDNPEARALARQDILDAVGVRATMAGWAPDVVAAARVEALTKMHQQVIENMIDVDPAGASAYFEAHKPEIAGSTHDALRQKITTGKDIRAAQVLADGIWSRGLSESEALAAVRKEAEGQVREQALVLLRTQFNEQKGQVDEYRRAKVDSAWALFNEGGMTALPPSLVAELQRVDPTTLTNMQARQWTPQDAIVTNWDTYYTLVNQAQSDRASFADLDLRHHMGELNEREFNTLAKLQADIREKRASPTATLTQMLSEVAWDSDDKERQGLFDRRVRESVSAEQQKLARELTESETRAIIDRQLIDVTIPRSWWTDRSAQLFEVTPEERAQMQVEYDAIPASDRAELEEDLRAVGQDATPQRVVEVYRSWLQKGNQ